MKDILTNLSVADLKRAIQIREQIEVLEHQLTGIFGTSGNGSPQTQKRGTMSAAGRARVAAAQKARWAKQGKAKLAGKRAGKRRRSRQAGRNCPETMG